MRFRKLRITWSVVCGVPCVLLLVLWVRSYWRWDFIQYEGVVVTREATAQNGFVFFSEQYTQSKGRWRLGSAAQDYPAELRPHFAIDWYDNSPKDIGFVFPLWLLILPFAILAMAPWISWKFNIRQLLAITAVFALLLGLLAFGSNSW